MTIPNLQIDPLALSTMLQYHEAHRHEWSALDLREMLKHQLDAPLHLALGPLSAEVAHFLKSTEQPSVSRMTLAQLLHQPSPPLELLLLVKRFAKICRRSPENPLPPEIAMFLYYTSIAVAASRLDKTISDLDDGSMLRGLWWLSAQSWIPDEMRAVLQERLDHLRTRDSTPPG